MREPPGTVTVLGAPGGGVRLLCYPRSVSMKKTGKIRDNALKATLRTPLFKQRREIPKKGKGSYSRKGRAPRQAA